MNREETLHAAMQAVMHDRNKDYKDPEDNFSEIADLWNWWLQRRYGAKFTLTPTDIAILSMFIKVARMLGNVYNEDNFVDIAGYAACAAETASIEKDGSGGTYVDGGVRARPPLSGKTE